MAVYSAPLTGRERRRVERVEEVVRMEGWKRVVLGGGLLVHATQLGRWRV